MHTYKVITTFCDDVVFEHYPEELSVATREYADQLGSAIEPPLDNPKARHVRTTEFQVLDENEAVVRKIESPIFPCEHRV